MSKFFQPIGLAVDNNPHVRPYEETNENITQAPDGWEEITAKQYRDYIKEYQAYRKKVDAASEAKATEKAALILSARKQIAESAKLSTEQMAALGF